ncbi:MAG: hypothetical protein KatS3mg087_0286 [Patescibacteria group bacterium]|nr:MAG: hypothetical protein KatS3mg087_0286 [Patescibacteria group bacterium]
MQKSGHLAKLNKSQAARTLGVSRSSLYYVRKRPQLDEELKVQIDSVMTSHTDCGHKRVAIHLKMSKERIGWVMKKYNLKPARRRRKKSRKQENEGKEARQVANVSKTLCPIAPLVVWVADFTYIRFHNNFVYLATIMDRYTREIVGWYVGRIHQRF